MPVRIGINNFMILGHFYLVHDLRDEEYSCNKETEISKLIKAFPKDIAALDKRSVRGRNGLQCWNESSKHYSLDVEM